jgi:nucleotide-binding universal stress UspA family protein
VSDSRTKKAPTIPMRRIVFATDFLESSRLALDYAVAFSHHYMAQLIIVHAFELPHEAEEAEFITHRPSLSREHALARLEGFAAGVRRLGISTEIDLREGEPCAAILSSASENQADLLVLGTHGIYRGLQHVLLGSNAEKILLSSHYPTLTVGRHVMSGIDLDLGFSEILYVSDFSPESVAAAHYALALGRDLGIRTEFLPVAHDGANEGRDSREEMERFCAELDSDGQIPYREWCDPAYLLGRILTDDELLDHCRTRSRSLLVLAVHSESRLNRHLHSSFAYELVAKASCPLLSVCEPARSDPAQAQNARA